MDELMVRKSPLLQILLICLLKVFENALDTDFSGFQCFVNSLIVNQFCSSIRWTPSSKSSSRRWAMPDTSSWTVESSRTTSLTTASRSSSSFGRTCRCRSWTRSGSQVFRPGLFFAWHLKDHSPIVLFWLKLNEKTQFLVKLRAENPRDRSLSLYPFCFHLACFWKPAPLCCLAC